MTETIARSEPDPLSVRCSACLAEPGAPCIATSSDLPREHPHRLRGLAAAATLRRCPRCEGTAWAPSAEGPTAPDAITCPVCEAAPGAACTEGGQDRGEQHVVRMRAAGLGVERCGGCGAGGWVPGEPSRPAAEPEGGEESGVPVDWEAVVRQRERELKQVGEARHQAEAVIEEVRRLQEMTIATSCRAGAIEQAEDTLRLLARPTDLTYRADRAVAALRELVGEPCQRTPGTTYCQTHGHPPPCPHAAAQRELAVLDRLKEIEA